MLNKTLVAAIAAVMLGSGGASLAATRASDLTLASPAAAAPKAHKATAKKHKAAKAHKAVRHVRHAPVHRVATHKVAVHHALPVQTRAERMQEARLKWERSHRM